MNSGFHTCKTSTFQLSHLPSLGYPSCLSLVLFSWYNIGRWSQSTLFFLLNLLAQAPLFLASARPIWAWRIGSDYIDPCLACWCHAFGNGAGRVLGTSIWEETVPNPVRYPQVEAGKPAYLNGKRGIFLGLLTYTWHLVVTQPYCLTISQSVLSSGTSQFWTSNNSVTFTIYSSLLAFLSFFFPILVFSSSLTSPYLLLPSFPYLLPAPHPHHPALVQRLSCPAL